MYDNSLQYTRGYIMCIKYFIPLPVHNARYLHIFFKDDATTLSHVLYIIKKQEARKLTESIATK